MIDLLLAGIILLGCAMHLPPKKVDNPIKCEVIADNVNHKLYNQCKDITKP